MARSLIYPPWSGFGINVGSNFSNSSSYDSVTRAQFLADLAYIGQFTKRIRMFMPKYDDTTHINVARAAILDAVAAGFNVTWGVTGGSVSQTRLKQSNWSLYTAGVLAQAAWAQANGVTTFGIGNEEELHTEATRSNLTSSGTTATYTSQGNHGFSTGDTVSVLYCNQPEYAGPGAITVLDATSFTYIMSGTAASPATFSTIGRATDIPRTDLATKIRALATAVKAVFSGTVIYTCLQDQSDHWFDGSGKGALDFLCINLYSVHTTLFRQQAKSLATTYPSAAYLTEINIDNDWSRVMSSGFTDPEVARQLKAAMEYCRGIGLPYLYPYTFRTSDNTFSALKSDGNFREWWPQAARVRPWFSGIPNVAITAKRPTITRSRTLTRSVI